jgi:hypothetical protein
MFIANCDVGDQQYIAPAYQDARVFVASMSSGNDPGWLKTLDCLERIEAYQAVGDIAATGWMVELLQQRISTLDLETCGEMSLIADTTGRLLSQAGRTTFH